MLLQVIIDDQVHPVEVPAALLDQATDFFDRVDRDLDGGVQMSREWVDAPDREQRARVVADKLLTALETENRRLALLMAGYLLHRLPGLAAVEPDTHGEIQNTSFTLRPDPLPARGPDHPLPSAGPPGDRAGEPAGEPVEVRVGGTPRGLSRLAAMTQAGQDVTKVFKVGKGWRFSIYHQATGTWQDAPLIATEAEAERLREQAVRERFEQLLHG